jgi:hypothetical protein
MSDTLKPLARKDDALQYEIDLIGASVLLERNS